MTMHETDFRDTVITSLATLEANSNTTSETLKRIEKAVFTGNGTPSLVAQVATLNADIDTIKRAVPAKVQDRKETAVTSAGVATLVLGVIMAIEKLWPMLKIG